MHLKFSSLLFIALASLFIGSVVSTLFIFAAKPPEIVSIFIIPLVVLITYAILSILYSYGMHRNLQHAIYRRHNPPRDQQGGVREPRRPYHPTLSDAASRPLPTDDV